MKPQLAGLLLLVPRLIASPATAQEPGAAGTGAPGVRTPGWGFTIDLGPDLIMGHSPRGPDFEVYHVLSRSDTASVLFSIYAGNHPQPQDWHDATPVDGALKGRTVQRETPDGRLSRDIVLELSKAVAPTLLHVWYRDLPPANAARADGRLRPSGLRAHKAQAEAP